MNPDSLTLEQCETHTIKQRPTFFLSLKNLLEQLASKLSEQQADRLFFGAAMRKYKNPNSQILLEETLT